jgi:hypothetical protein
VVNDPVDPEMVVLVIDPPVSVTDDATTEPAAIATVANVDVPETDKSVIVVVPVAAIPASVLIPVATIPTTVLVPVTVRPTMVVVDDAARVVNDPVDPEMVVPVIDPPVSVTEDATTVPAAMTAFEIVDVPVAMTPAREDIPVTETVLLTVMAVVLERPSTVKVPAEAVMKLTSTQSSCRVKYKWGLMVVMASSPAKREVPTRRAGVYSTQRIST